ncbi:hypothetical protein DXV75_02680 [Alteromonas aestuariivivens]|uniref:Cellulose-binding Sde182 nucleoside hydrolase-like domain-containing protein n=1 Tax=Alteromonas aestuariivivens TaxID=1938339 RepID=A0A3D8MFL6_9ALTE|nr:nucleoside hydrolase-like domain-containing protein [Alteromonas aestuariivivens]RDV29371.1 hypothetical protein DXV75_02680 [Alteromonas aestuariivivens]
MKRSLLLAGLLLGSGLSLAQNSNAEQTQPHVWVYSDLSDPRDRRSGGHPQNDPDDIVSLASLLLSSNRYHIAAVVVGSTNRKNLHNPLPFLEQTFIPAYQHDRKALIEHYPDMQATIPFYWSSLTQQPQPHKFDPQRDYTDLTEFPTVKALVKYARQQPVWVLNWGPMTESAIVVKHLLDTSATDTLKNLRFVSHWTKSSLAQGSPQAPFDVANCRDDGAACHYLHEQAAQQSGVFLIELGAVGQTGIVNGSNQWKEKAEFDLSRLGQIFYRAKYYFGQPDQSDAATHWLLSGIDGLSASLYPQDGGLSQQLEADNQQRFYQAAPAIMADLNHRSQLAAGEPFSTAHIAEYFTYVYRKRDHYELYLPYNGMNYMITDASGKQVEQGQLPRGNHRLEGLPVQEEKAYQVTISYQNWQKTYWL